MIITQRTHKAVRLAASLSLALASTAHAGSGEIEQITGNVQTTTQTGDGNSATVEQSAVAAGLVPGAGNLAGITQNGSDNRAEIVQKGSGLDAEVTQTGDANAAGIDQRGTDLKFSVEQSGDASVQVYQSGTGNGQAVSVTQY